jgi:hypothetical protein
MQKSHVFILALLCFISSVSAHAQNVLDTWNPPSGTTANTTFTVQVKKQGDVSWTDLYEYNVKVGHQNGSVNNSSMVNFDFSGTVDIKLIYNSGTITSYDIRPWSYGVNATQSSNTLTFSITQNAIAPRKIVVRINNGWETEVLHINTNLPETGSPSAGASNVYAVNPGDPVPYELPAGKNTYYFKPGVHTLPKGLWLELDLGASYAINKISLDQATYQTNAGKIKYVVETKLNAGDSYTTAYDGTSNTATGSIIQTFTAVNARYVRLKLLGNNAASSYVFASVINEFGVYASADTVNLALNKAIGGGMPGYNYAVDGNNGSAYISSTGYGNWHAGESFYLGKNGTTVYIAKGAAVKGSFMSDQVSNVTIKGRGLLDCSGLRHALTSPQSEGRTGAIWMVSGSDNRVEGITILDPPMWSIVMNFSARPVVKGVLLFGSDVNSDGVHFSGSNNGLVDHVFFRACDDLLVMYHYGAGSNNTFKNSVFWGDDAHIVLIGLSGNGGGQPINNLRFQNIDILNQQGVYDLDKFNGCLKLWPNGGNTISDIVFDNIRIDSFRTAGNAAIFQFRADERFSGENAGSLKNITISNLTYNGKYERQSLLKGVDANHDVNGVNFVNYVREGAVVTDAASGNINIQSYVSNVNFTNGLLPSLANLALNKTASSDQGMYTGHGADKAVDGTITGFAQGSSRTTPWKLTIDLDSSIEFTRIVFKSGVTEYASQYTIEGSNNGSSWTTLVTEAASTGLTKTYKNFGKANYRYVRLHPTACILSPGDWGYTILDFEIYNDSATAPESLNLALNKPVLSDQEMYTGYNADKTNDGNIGTYAQASSRTTPWKLTVDLGAVKTFNRVVLKSGTTNYASAYTIEASDDRLNWHTLVNETAGAGGTKAYNAFGNVAYRYLRLNPASCVLDAGASWGYAVLEFEVYNDTTGTKWSRRNDNATAAYYYSCPVTTVAGYYMQDCHYSNMPGSYAEFSFNGTGIRWVGKKSTDHGKAEVYIDGILDSIVDTYSPTDTLQATCYQKTGLTSGEHIIRIVVRNDKNSLSTGYYSDWDAFDFYAAGATTQMNATVPQPEIFTNGKRPAWKKLYPNPFTDRLLIDMPAGNKNYSYQLLNLKGILLKQGMLSAGTNALQMKNIVPGMYLLAIYSATEGYYIQRIVKTNN